MNWLISTTSSWLFDIRKLLERRNYCGQTDLHAVERKIQLASQASCRDNSWRRRSSIR